MEFGRCKSSRNCKLIVISILAAIIFILVRSNSTSPLYMHYFSYGGAYDGGDSLQFQTIGKMWLHGKVPYIDIFDHKGPMIFFIDLLGYLIGLGKYRYGIALIQIIFAAFTIFYVGKVSDIYFHSLGWDIFQIALYLLMLTYIYSSGNSVQEYNMPFLMASVYFIYRYFTLDKGNIEHNPKWALIYGTAAGVAVVLQITNITVVAVGTLIIFIHLVYNKKWNNIRQNILYFIAGLLIITLPFLAYFFAQHAIDEMFFCSFTFNAEYAEKIGSWTSHITRDSIKEFIDMNFILFCSFLVGIITIKKNKYISMILIGSAILGITFSFKVRLYSQYSIPYLVLTPVIINTIYDWTDIHGRISFTKRFAVIIIVACICGNFLNKSLAMVHNNINNEITYDQFYLGYENLMDAHLNEIRASTFTAYAGNDGKGIYLRYDLETNNKYFTIQNWHASFSDRVKEDMVSDFKNNMPEYLLADYIGDNLSDIVKKNYTVCDRSDRYVLYKRNH